MERIWILRRTGEIRPPIKGEWYVKDGKPERAAINFSTLWEILTLEERLGYIIPVRKEALEGK